MRIVSVMMLAILMAGFVVLAFNVRLAECKPRMIVVPDDYASIQDAVSNASAGDTIFVRAGTYSGHIEINKPLTLEGENNQNTTVKLLGANYDIENQTPWIQFTGIYVAASNVKIEGFNFTPIIPDLRGELNGQKGISSPILILLDGQAAACTDDTIENNVLADQGSHLAGIYAISISHSAIVNNTVEHNSDASEEWCIYMTDSDYNLISYNTVVGAEAGIFLSSSAYNVLLGNYISNQVIMIEEGGGGIELTQSSSNVVVGNTLTATELGVNLYYASGNLLYHNNFVENARNAFVGVGCFSNAWDNGYPSGGNYWSDYNGTDLYSGPYQNVTGSDGIGDTPYVISNQPLSNSGGPGVYNTDRYPLMNPMSNGRIIGDVNMDGHVDGSDMALVASSFGAYGPNYLYPGSPPSINWNPDCDINGDGVIDGSDLTLVALNFGK